MKAIPICLLFLCLARSSIINISPTFQENCKPTYSNIAYSRSQDIQVNSTPVVYVPLATAGYTIGSLSGQTQSNSAVVTQTNSQVTNDASSSSSA
jgi:hypothetical protein